MSQASSYRDLALHKQLINLESELNKLKTQQNYSTGDITSVETEWITINSYEANNGNFFPGWTVYEVAATFKFTGSLSNKMAIGMIESSPSSTDGTMMLWQAFLPSDTPNILRFGIVYRMGNTSGKNIKVRLHANMTGKFELERTYNVPIT